MEHLFQGIPGVVVYIDGILVTGKDEASHLKSLEEVLKRLLEDCWTECEERKMFDLSVFSRVPGSQN